MPSRRENPIPRAEIGCQANVPGLWRARQIFLVLSSGVEIKLLLDGLVVSVHGARQARFASKIALCPSQLARF